MKIPHLGGKSLILIDLILGLAMGYRSSKIPLIIRRSQLETMIDWPLSAVWMQWREKQPGRHATESNKLSNALER